MEKPSTKGFSSNIEWDLINDLGEIPEKEDFNFNEYLLYRLERGLTYTWIGPILLSLNPDQNISIDLCHSTNYKDFLNFSKVLQKEMQPHIFAVTAKSHYKLLHELGRPSQVILISGDSGSGKTYNANQAVNFLAAINKISPTLPVHCKKVEEFVEKIVSACPLITAFSTASTSKNARSSRHGQLIRFDYEEGVISGAFIQSFLLERSRVTRGNDNFAIFYQVVLLNNFYWVGEKVPGVLNIMTSGFSELDLEKLGISKQETYDLIGTNLYIAKNQLAEDFQETLNAMRALGFSEDEKMEILEVVALLIQLGNINFKQSSGDGCFTIDTENKKSRKALENACALSSLSEKNLSELLTTTLISTKSQRRRGSIYRRSLGSREICRNRLFGIIRHLYDNLFHWLIDRINQSLSAGDERHNWLGILDIFGFESFATNGIEELSINYVNERLQLYFMQEYLKSEQQILWEEGLSDISTPEIINIYIERLSVMEINLFSILNDASQSPIQCNIFQLRNQILVPATCKFFRSRKDEAFIINHYSRPVEYSLQDLLSKNNDKVPHELTSAFITSSNRLLQYISTINEDHISYQSNSIYARKGTTLAKVKRSLDTLLRKLKKCDIHYVKCVRPRRIRGIWERKEFNEQLACSGILDALPLARFKFPIRLNYNEFINRYSQKFPANSLPNHEYCKGVLQEITDQKTLSSSVYFGKNVIFLEKSFFFQLESQRNEYRTQCAVRIQKFWKNYQDRKVLNLKSPEKRIFFMKYNAEKLLSTDQKIEDNLSDYEKEIFPTSNNKGSEIKHHDFHSEVGELNSNQYEPEKGENTEKQISTPLKDQFHDDVQLNLKKDLKRNSYLCSDASRFMTTFVSQKANGVSTMNGKKGITKIIKVTKEMYERPKLQLMRIQNGLQLKLNPNGNCYIVFFGHDMFFYRNRIISRQRLAEVPIRFHTRVTSLLNSHRLPRSELPCGLEDCL